MINIIVYSIKRLKYEIKQNNLVIDDNVFAIINTSYPNDLDELKDIPNNILILNFDDIQDFSGNSFDESMAQDIKLFVDNIPNNATLYVCCDAGVSRSAAIASAIMRYLGQDYMKIWKDPHFQPNVFVFSILSNVLGYNDTEDELKELQRINSESLSNTINNSR